MRRIWQVEGNLARPGYREGWQSGRGARARIVRRDFDDLASATRYAKDLVEVGPSTAHANSAATIAASLLQRMESDSRWHMPVVSDGRVVGVVSKEDLLRLLAHGRRLREESVGLR
jgi:CBS domain-containing protein